MASAGNWRDKLRAELSEELCKKCFERAFNPVECRHGQSCRGKGDGDCLKRHCKMQMCIYHFGDGCKKGTECEYGHTLPMCSHPKTPSQPVVAEKQPSLSAEAQVFVPTEEWWDDLDVKQAELEASASADLEANLEATQRELGETQNLLDLTTFHNEKLLALLRTVFSGETNEQILERALKAA